MACQMMVSRRQAKLKTWGADLGRRQATLADLEAEL
jgi:hypothetical protein